LSITPLTRVYSRLVANQDTNRTKAKVRFWWEIYRVLFNNQHLRDALGLEQKWPNTLAFYQKWGDVSAVEYDEWWKSHHAIFHEEPSGVREVMTRHYKRNPHCLYLELNLNSRASDLIAEVRSLLRTKRNAFQGGTKKKQKKSVPGFTQGAEIRPTAYEDYIVFLKDVYAPNCLARSIELREFAQKQCHGKIRKFPSLQLDRCNNNKPIAYISIKRYRDKVRQLCRAVANGEFPGAA